MNYPFVSIIIPVRNEEKHIGDCLEYIIRQAYPKDKMEILLIDGMSEDKTRDIVSEYARKQDAVGGVPIILKENPKRTPYAGVNIGVKEAKGEIIARIDARVILPRNYLVKCIETLLQTGAWNVGGVQQQIGKSLIQKAIALAVNNWFGSGGAAFRSGKKGGFVDTVYLGCFRREVFDRLGLFDESGPIISEDAEMNYRIRKIGGKVYLNKEIIVQYWAKENLRSLWRQYFIYGGAKAHTFLRLKRFTASRQAAPLIFLCILFVFPILSLWNTIFLFLWVTAIASYLLVDFFVSFLLSLKSGEFSFFPRLLVIFPCIHFSWALGFLVRLAEGKTPKAHWRNY